MTTAQQNTITLTVHIDNELRLNFLRWLQHHSLLHNFAITTAAEPQPATLLVQNPFHDGRSTTIWHSSQMTMQHLRVISLLQIKSAQKWHFTGVFA